MRRLAVLLVLLSLVAALLPASGGDSLGAFTPLYNRSLGMGGTGVASARYGETLYTNPALVGVDNQYFSTPSVSFTLYNVNKLVQPGGALDIFFTQDDADRAFDQLINSIGSGRGDVMSAQMSFGFISGITGLGIDAALDVHSQGQGGEASTLVLEGDFAMTLAISVPITVAEEHTFSLGAGAHLVFRGFSIQDMDEPVQVGGFTAGRILGFYGDEDILASVLNEVPVAFGFAIPLDFGFTYDWREIFTFGLALRNVNGEYHMQTYSGTNQLYYMLTGGYIGSSPPGEAETGVSYSFHTPMSLDVGIALRTPDGGFWDWVDMTFAFDVVDVWDLLFVEKPTLEGFISRMRTGVELSLMRTFDFRFGLNAGYMSFGFTFDFQIMTIDLTYATLEYGDATGDKPLDLFSIAFRIGLEN